MSSNIANSDGEEMAIITTAGIILPLALIGAGAWITTQSARAVRWLLDHRVLVPADDALVTIAHDAGVDLLRIITLVAIISTLAFAMVRFSPRKKAPAE